MREKKEDLSHPQENDVENLLALVDFTPPTPKNELVLAELVSLESGEGFGVIYPGSPTPTPCLSTVSLNEESLHRKVAVMFLEGSPSKPVVLGLIMEPQQQATPMEVSVDRERLQIVGKKEIELRCGKASILMKANGKIIIKGTHLVSRSSGPNKIKGASISLN